MYHFIVNPNSRTGTGIKIWNEVKAILLKEQIPCKVCFTDHACHASELMSALCEQGLPFTAVILGGDGTINEAIQGITRPELVTLGYIPIGSGNDFARDYQLPLEPSEALLNILSPKRIVPMDLGCVTGSDSRKRLFAGSSGMGYDAAVCLEALGSPIKKALNRLKLGKFTYIAIALHQIFTFAPCAVTVRLDGGARMRYPRTYFVCVMNHPYEGGGLMLAPFADGGDGLLDVCIVSGLPKALLLLLLPTAFFGKHLCFRRYITYRRCRSVTLRAPRPLAVHTDGESFGFHKAVTIRPSGRSIRVIAGDAFPKSGALRDMSEIGKNPCYLKEFKRKSKYK